MLTPTDKAAIEGLIELGNRMRAVDKAAAAAWNQPTDTEHDRLSLEADKLFEEFAHASEAALPALQRLLSGETREAVWEPAIPISEIRAMWAELESLPPLVSAGKLMSGLAALVTKYQEKTP